MSSLYPAVFVCAATGTQGEAVVRKLCEVGWKARATVRNPDSPTARALKALGVELTPGDWDNSSALETAMTGCKMLFLNLISFTDLISEKAVAKRILDIAKAAGVKHVVYSTSAAVSHLDEIKDLDKHSIAAGVMRSKRDIEKMVMEAGFEAWTILRPGHFMANFLLPKAVRYPELVQKNTWTTAMIPSTKIALIDQDDIAKFAVAAFQDQKRFHRQEITIASELLTPGEMLSRLGTASGRPMKAVFYTEEEIEERKKTDLFIQGQLMMKAVERFVDLEEVNKWGIPMGTFEEFLERHAEEVKATYP
ncbi:NAD(P)-binding protein [Xylariaceae sp. AK1471]|nr:NAD(P)-binding protein [Xylariaceae sp. AK1471]